jgi:Integrase core domain
LETWCKEQGIEIHLTAPYSPSQNGVAERMNRTLAELGHAMLIGNDLPEFLWEYSIMHAAYLRNHTYTKHLPNSTPYQGWHNEKPNVAHCKGKTLQQQETAHSENGKGQGIAKGC